MRSIGPGLWAGELLLLEVVVGLVVWWCLCLYRRVVRLLPLTAIQWWFSSLLMVVVRLYLVVMYLTSLAPLSPLFVLRDVMLRLTSSELLVLVYLRMLIRLTGCSSHWLTRKGFRTLFECLPLVRLNAGEACRRTLF